MRYHKLFLPLYLFLFSVNSLCGQSGNGMAAIKQAVQEDKDLFVFFYKEKNARTERAEKIFDEFLKSSGAKVSSIKIDSTSPAERPMLDKFNLNRSPMPFVLVLAPNGAIMGAYASSFTVQMLTDSISSRVVASCLKALQDNKLVFLCLQNQHTIHNEAALKGVMDFKSDARFSNNTEVIMADPADKEERRFLNQLSVNPQLNQATTILIAPPAETIGQYIGATHSEQFVADLQKAVSGCCGPGGCCPGNCCSPKK